MAKWNKNGLSTVFKLLGQNRHSVDDVGRLLANYGDDVALSLAKTPGETVQNLNALAGNGSGLLPSVVKRATGIAPKITSSNAIPKAILQEIPTTRFLGNVNFTPSRIKSTGIVEPGFTLPLVHSYSTIPSVRVPNLDTKNLVIDHIQTGAPILYPKNSNYTETILRPHNNTALGRWFRKKMGQNPLNDSDKWLSATLTKYNRQELSPKAYFHNKEIYDSLHDEPIQTMFEKLYTPKKRVPKFSPSDFPDDFLTIVGAD